MPAKPFTRCLNGLYNPGLDKQAGMGYMIGLISRFQFISGMLSNVMA